MGFTEISLDAFSFFMDIKLEEPSDSQILSDIPWQKNRKFLGTLKQ